MSPILLPYWHDSLISTVCVCVCKLMGVPQSPPDTHSCLLVVMMNRLGNSGHVLSNYNPPRKLLIEPAWPVRSARASQHISNGNLVDIDISILNSFVGFTSWNVNIGPINWMLLQTELSFLIRDKKLYNDLYKLQMFIHVYVTHIILYI